MQWPPMSSNNSKWPKIKWQSTLVIQINTQFTSQLLKMEMLPKWKYCQQIGWIWIGNHCMKGVQVQIFFWPVFSRIRARKKLRIWTLFTLWTGKGRRKKTWGTPVSTFFQEKHWPVSTILFFCKVKKPV